jgi:hypothetical protein
VEALEKKSATLTKENAEGEEKYKLRKKVLDLLPEVCDEI